jgi:Ni2+-binding GTPase involved in maturation of urease and hydrogenase
MTAHYLMIGGFLGAGKTTALLRAGESLSRRGLRAGLIMNDQSGGLVDTALARSRDLAVEEVAGGCFCCRFNSLLEAAGRLTRDARPDVFLAEPVGSCTDLSATVALPLRQLYGDQYRVAPLSVLMDPDRALRILGLEPGQAFSPKVQYVYGKQLEEADVLVVNKIDRISAERRGLLRRELERRYPAARIVEISARTGEGVDGWIEWLLAAESGSHVLDIDYDTYAEGEALLGWLNCTARLESGGVEADEFLLRLAERIYDDLSGAAIEIAHLKLTLVPVAGGGISVVNAIGTGVRPEPAFTLDAAVDRAEITINLRAEGDPVQLEQAVIGAVTSANRDGTCSVIMEHLERFRPARPTPTHRMGAVSTDRRP